LEETINFIAHISRIQQDKNGQIANADTHTKKPKKNQTKKIEMLSLKAVSTDLEALSKVIL